MTRDSRQDKLQFKEINKKLLQKNSDWPRSAEKMAKKTAGHKITLKYFSFTKINAHLNR
jgi:hypothetical protein